MNNVWQKDSWCPSQMKFIEILFLQHRIDRHAVFISQQTKIRLSNPSCIADVSFITPSMDTNQGQTRYKMLRPKDQHKACRLNPAGLHL